MIASTLSRLSAGFSAVERLLLKLLMAALAIFVLMNVLLRMVGVTVAWADEIGVYTMIMSGFVGASLMLRARIDPAVMLLHQFVSPQANRILRGIVSAISVTFGTTLLYLCWMWFNPSALIAAGLDVGTFEAATFNFVYTDVTPVMGLPAWYFYSVIPFFALAITIHALTNLCEDLGLIERPADPAGVTGGDI